METKNAHDAFSVGGLQIKTVPPKCASGLADEFAVASVNAAGSPP